MAWVHHINLKTEEDRVYCCLRNKVVTFGPQQLSGYCVSCKMFGGTAQGTGVECFWNDAREINNPHTVTEPDREFHELQRRTGAESPCHFTK